MLINKPKQSFRVFNIPHCSPETCSNSCQPRIMRHELILEALLYKRNKERLKTLYRDIQQAPVPGIDLASIAHLLALSADPLPTCSRPGLN